MTCIPSPLNSGKTNTAHQHSNLCRTVHLLHGYQQIILFCETDFCGITHKRIFAQARADPGLLGPPLNKKEYKTQYESEYFFRMRKEITTNYKF
jgi:hypothetical protein